MTRHVQATWFLLGATVVWGASFPLTHALGEIQLARLPGVSTWFLAAVTMAARFGLAGFLLLLFSWRNCLCATSLEWQQGIGLALFATGGLIFQIDGLYHTTASISAFITQTYCVWIPLWLILRGRQRPRWVQGISILLVLAGVAQLSGIDWQNFRMGRGETETLISSFFFAGQILWLERPAFRSNRPLVFSTLMFLAIAVFMLGLAFATLRQPADFATALQGSSIFWLLLILTLLCTLGTFLVMNFWQPFVTATEAGLIYCLEPVSAALFALFLPGLLSLWLGISSANETFTRHLLLGGILILAANILVQILPLKRAG